MFGLTFSGLGLKSQLIYNLRLNYKSLNISINLNSLACTSNMTFTCCQQHGQVG